MTVQHVGKNVPRVDAVRKATGEALFVADIVLPRMLHAKVLRAGIPHGKIRSFDTSKAEAMPGVKKVVTGRGAECFSAPASWTSPLASTGPPRGRPVAVVSRRTENRRPLR